MAIRKELLDEMLKDYHGPDDFYGPDGIIVSVKLSSENVPGKEFFPVFG